MITVWQVKKSRVFNHVISPNAKKEWKMDRKIILHDHTRNTDIKKRTQIEDASHAAQEIKWR